jgi:hypothetical protein
MKILIDGDGFIYRCGFAVEKTKYLVTDVTGTGPVHPSEVILCDSHKEAKEVVGDKPEIWDIWSRKEVEPIEHAITLLRGALGALPYDGDKEIYLTPSVGNFRDRIATLARYKGNRDTARRPVHYDALRKHIIEHFGAVTATGEEADDVLGIRQSACGDRSVIVSFDKDLDQIAGRHYNWVERREYIVSRRDADFNFYTQILSGDPVDNVMGLPGIGPAKAKRELEGSKNTWELWSRVLACYQAEYGEFGYDVALETARLVYVRRKEEELWVPPDSETSFKAA